MHEDDLYRLEDLLRMIQTSKDLADFERRILTRATVEESNLAVLLHSIFCKKNHNGECDFYTENRVTLTTWENLVKELKRINNLGEHHLKLLRRLISDFQLILENNVKEGGISTLTAFYDLFEIPPHKRLHTIPKASPKTGLGILPETPVVS